MSEKELGMSILEPTIIIGPSSAEELDNEFPEGEEGEV